MILRQPGALIKQTVSKPINAALTHKTGASDTPASAPTVSLGANNDNET